MSKNSDIFTDQIDVSQMFATEQPKDKDDKDKSFVYPFLYDFSNALLEVSSITEFGVNKYGFDNWHKIHNAKYRYLNAAIRHLYAHLQMSAKGENPIDADTGKLHLAHIVWNLLAVIELSKREEFYKKE